MIPSQLSPRAPVAEANSKKSISKKFSKSQEEDDIDFLEQYLPQIEKDDSLPERLQKYFEWTLWTLFPFTVSAVTPDDTPDVKGDPKDERSATAQLIVLVQSKQCSTR